MAWSLMLATSLAIGSLISIGLAGVRFGEDLGFSRLDAALMSSRPDPDRLETEHDFRLHHHWYPSDDAAQHIDVSSVEKQGGEGEAAAPAPYRCVHDLCATVALVERE